MTLSIAGQTQFADMGLSGGTLMAVVQIPDDLDSFVFVHRSGTGDQVYKFTWPDTLALIVDLGTTYSSVGATYGRGAIAQDFSWSVGYKDETWHYGIHASRGGTYGPVAIIDINIDTGAYTAYDLGGVGGASYSNGDCWVFYDGTGASFFGLYSFSGSNSMSAMIKRYGVAGGLTDSIGTGGMQNHILLQYDDVTWLIYSDATWKKLSMTGSNMGEGGDLGVTYLVRTNAIYSNLSYCQDVNPTRAVWWDNWRYFFGIGTLVAGGSVTVYGRKNIVTGQHDVVSVVGGSGSGTGIQTAFDIGEIGDVARIYFSLLGGAGYSDTVYASLPWPLDQNNKIVTDAGAVNQAIWTDPSDSSIYAFHAGGSLGICVTKLIDTELVSGVATPSISSPGLLTLWKDKRVFFSGVTNYERYLWWSQAYELQSLDVGWDGYNTTVFDDENVTCLIPLEDSVYIGSKKGWVRLRGKSPDHWALDKTLGDSGPYSNKSVAVTPFGAIYPREDGLRVFNAYSTRFFAEQANPILNNVNWDEIDKAFSLWDGRYYRFFYPSGSATANDRELIVDLIAGIGNERVTEGDRAASAGWYDFPTQTMYLGTEGGVVAVGGTSGARSFLASSKEFPAANLMDAGSFSTLHYDIDNKGIPVVITPIYDGTEQATVSIPAYNGRKRGRISLPKGNAYRVGIKVTVTTDQDIRLYEPWFLE